MEKKLDTNMYVYFGSEHYDRELFKNDKNLGLTSNLVTLL